MSNIVLTGFMASGKTKIGKAIAQIGGYGFIDTDEMIIQRMGISINEIFEKYGEDYFRELEREAVKEAGKEDNAVISTGGGVVLDKQNIENLRENGVIFNLSPAFEVIEQRLKDAAASRPLLKNQETEKIRKRFDERKPYYDNCDFKIEVSNDKDPGYFANKIIKIFKEEKYS